MPTLNNAMYIGLSGMQANQIGLNVTGQNISNVNTKGYTRQTLKLEANTPIRINNQVFGTGVNVLAISRYRDSFIDRQYRYENGLMGDLNKQAESLSLIEGVINEPSDSGLQNAIKNFFNSLQDLAGNPESSSIRVTVREQGRTLGRIFQQVHNQLEQIRDTKNFEIVDRVSQINSILDRIGALNIEIGKTEGFGQQANDLRDTRDNLLDELSGMVDMSVTEDPVNGSATVSINGQAFVVHGQALHLVAESHNLDGKEVMRVINPTNKLEINFTSGELDGMITVRDEIVPKLQSNLDTLATAIIESVNAVHVKGFGLQGNRLSVPSGLKFFEGTDASTMQLSFAIENDPGNIAASLSGEPGDNSNALALAQLRNERVLNNNSFSFEDFLGGMISTFGLETVNVQDRLENQERLTEHLVNFRESVNGVNLDEELANLIRFQKAFGASARIITTFNDMMDVVVNLGRY